MWTVLPVLVGLMLVGLLACDDAPTPTPTPVPTLLSTHTPVIPPGAVQHLGVINVTEDSITLQWEPPPNSDVVSIERYEVTRDIPFAPDEHHFVLEPTFTDVGLRSGKEHKYRVRAIGQRGVEGPEISIERSTLESATPEPTPASEPTPVKAKAIQTVGEATPIPTSTPIPTRIPTATPVSGCPGLIISGSEFAAMTKSEFEQKLRREGCSQQQISNMLTTYDDDKERQARWVEQWDHWANVDAFAASMKEINADRVIDKDESARICFLLDQWTTQMEEARDYVVNYRKVEPDTVEKNSGLGNLQTEAERGLALLAEVKCE